MKSTPFNDMKSVITADIVGSTRINDEMRGMLPKLIVQITNELKKICPMRMEIFRGDSFQILVEEAEKAAIVAILFRAGLRKSDLMSGKKLLDARMAIGVGNVDYEVERLTLSNGEAFVLSGREFDVLGKRRLSVVTTSKSVNAELKVETAFVDDVISHWTKQQSECIYLALLTNAKQTQLAIDDKTSRQNITKKLSSAKERLVKMYIDRVSFLIKELQ